MLKNLLSNAFKFTHEGGVTLSIGYPVGPHGVCGATHSARPSGVIAFTVTDTGVGIPEDKLKMIFEAFQQADGTTSRKYGGTGLGPVDLARDRAACSAARSRSSPTSAWAAGSRLLTPTTPRTARRAPDSAPALPRQPRLAARGGKRGCRR